MNWTFLHMNKNLHILRRLAVFVHELNVNVKIKCEPDHFLHRNKISMLENYTFCKDSNVTGCFSHGLKVLMRIKIRRHDSSRVYVGFILSSAASENSFAFSSFTNQIHWTLNAPPTHFSSWSYLPPLNWLRSEKRAKPQSLSSLWLPDRVCGEHCFYKPQQFPETSGHCSLE